MKQPKNNIFNNLNTSLLIKPQTIFGQLTTTGNFKIQLRNYKGKNKTRRIYECVCICGKKVNYVGYKLKYITHCGCLNKQNKPKQQLINKNNKILPGTKINLLTCIKYLYTKINRGNYKTVYKWVCDCGKEKEIIGTSVIQGNTKSCGCLHKKSLLHLHQSKKFELSNKQILINQIYGVYRLAAQRKQRNFSLTKQDFENLIFCNCFYCGSFPNNKKIIRKTYEFFVVGIDRKDSSKGYELENVVPCCYRCNIAKSNLNYNEWINYLNNLVKYRSGLNEKQKS